MDTVNIIEKPCHVAEPHDMHIHRRPGVPAMCDGAGDRGPTLAEQAPPYGTHLDDEIRIGIEQALWSAHELARRTGRPVIVTRSKWASDSSWGVPMLVQVRR